MDIRRDVVCKSAKELKRGRFGRNMQSERGGWCWRTTITEIGR
jgi:hypothetical protein